jgi:(S)-citramalyl-CoA lyase
MLIHLVESGFSTIRPTELEEAAAIGFKGLLTDDPDLIGVADRVFRPRPDQLSYAESVCEALDRANENGSAAARLDGRMIDIPVATWARRLLALSEEISARDARKGARAP